MQRKPQKQTHSESTPKDPVVRRTRASRKTKESLGTGDFTPPPLTPEEQKSRENNLSHMTHIRKAMKSGLEKWKDEIKKEKDTVRRAWLKHQRDVLNSWLRDIEQTLDFFVNTPHYVPTVKMELKDAVQLKPSTALGDPAKKTPKRSRKPTARKSGQALETGIRDVFPEGNLSKVLELLARGFNMNIRYIGGETTYQEDPRTG